MVLFYTYIIRL